MMVVRYALSLLAVISASCNFNENSVTMNSGKADPEKYQPGALTLFLCGDVMLGRGVDQAFPVSVDPQIYESYIKDARQYVSLAEREGAEIPNPMGYEYIWGDAMEVWQNRKAAFKIINLETAVTTHGEAWPHKGIHYRMHPQNLKALAVAEIDFCSLANNHVMDWGVEGLLETITSLNEAGIANAGAGENLTAATKPVIFDTKQGRVLIYSCGTESSGIPSTWAAARNNPGLNFIADLGHERLERIAKDLEEHKQPGDVVIVSIHWGSNWGYEVPQAQQDFAHALIDEAGVDIVHGHSSHHPRPLEVYKNRLIIYGAGDFMNDYEGIGGHEEFRGELTLMYFPELDEEGKLLSLEMVPMEIRNFQLNYTTREDALWLQTVLDRESERFGMQVELNEEGVLVLKW